LSPILAVLQFPASSNFFPGKEDFRFSPRSFFSLALSSKFSFSLRLEVFPKRLPRFQGDPPSFLFFSPNAYLPSRVRAPCGVRQTRFVPFPRAPSLACPFFVYVFSLKAVACLRVVTFTLEVISPRASSRYLYFFLSFWFCESLSFSLRGLTPLPLPCTPSSTSPSQRRPPFYEEECFGRVEGLCFLLSCSGKNPFLQNLADFFSAGWTASGRRNFPFEKRCFLKDFIVLPPCYRFRPPFFLSMRTPPDGPLVSCRESSICASGPMDLGGVVRALRGRSRDTSSYGSPLRAVVLFPPLFPLSLRFRL